MKKLASLALTLVSGLSLHAFAHAGEPRGVGIPRYTLDESRLTPLMRFDAAQIDQSKNPCSDFSGYATGKWLAQTEIPADQFSWGGFDALGKRSLSVQHQLAEQATKLRDPTPAELVVGTLYVQGMDLAAIEAAQNGPIADDLDAIGKLSDGKSIVSWIQAQAALGRNPIFKLQARPDFKRSDTYTAYADQGGLGLPGKEFYLDPGMQPVREAYVSYLEKVFMLSGTPQDKAKGQALDVLAFETRLAKASFSAEDMASDVSRNYHPVTPQEANRLTPNFDWSAFFVSQGVALPASFSLTSPAFHQEVSRMISDTPIDEWQAYFRARAINQARPYLPEAYRAAFFNLYSMATGAREDTPRWSRVLETIEADAGLAMGELYAAAAFPPESKARMEEMVGRLTVAMQARLQKVSWMGDATRRKALDKWAAMVPKIGYPDQWRDWSGLRLEKRGYLADSYAAKAYNYRWQLNHLGQAVDRNEWFATPQTVNAFYDQNANEIVFPAAFLQPPYFDINADAALNYGGIGAVIGHEISHGYDDQGARFGPSGNLEEWWQPEDAAAFKRLADKMVTQYGAYEISDGLLVNGKLTLSENIADVAGLAVAYDAMQAEVSGTPDPMIDGLTRDQRFFLSWATVWRTKSTPEADKVMAQLDTHAPSRIRVFAPGSNLPQFGTSFGCKVGDPIIRSEADRILIW